MSNKRIFLENVIYILRRRYKAWRKRKRLDARRYLLNLLYGDCKHTHTFKIYMKDLPIEQAWYHKGIKMGKHDQIYIEGCYLCGKITMKDYGA